jgi:4,5-dihydroxyphthalate decarboxylase
VNARAAGRARTTSGEPTAKATVVLGDHHACTTEIRKRDAIAGMPVQFPVIRPVYDAFDDQIRAQRYDICEMAIGAFLQGRDAGKPLLLLPVVMAGGFQHKNLYATPAKQFDSPSDLAGGRIGVRSYSQTTALWVRAWLAEEYGVAPDSVKWVVTEGSHLDEYEDPDNVELIASSLTDVLVSGEIDAAILGARYAPPGVGPMLPDFSERDRRWYERYGFVPVNHLVTTTAAFCAVHPEVVHEVYRLLAEAIPYSDPGVAGGARHPAGLPPAVRAGFGQVRPAVELAACYAFDQRLISAPVDDVDRLFAFGEL